MQASNRAKARISELPDESFEQFTGMLRIESDEALPWREQSAADKSKWTRFACEVKGRHPSDYDNAYPPGPASQTEATSTQGQRRH